MPKAWRHTQPQGHANQEYDTHNHTGIETAKQQVGEADLSRSVCRHFDKGEPSTCTPRQGPPRYSYPSRSRVSTQVTMVTSAQVLKHPLTTPQDAPVVPHSPGIRSGYGTSTQTITGTWGAAENLPRRDAVQCIPLSAAVFRHFDEGEPWECTPRPGPLPYAYPSRSRRPSQADSSWPPGNSKGYCQRPQRR